MGLHEDINEQQWETFTNSHLKEAYLAMHGSIPREPYVVAFKNQFVYEGVKISEATKKNRVKNLTSNLNSIRDRRSRR